MRLLLDQGLPRSAASLLRQAGIDSVHVGEVGYAAAEDAEALTRLPQDLLSRCEAELEQGAVVTVQQATIRIRRLPLRS